MSNRTFSVKHRLAKKEASHNILMDQVKRLFKDNTLNLSELSRLTDIPYMKLRRLLFYDAVWTVDEWFKFMVVCDAPKAMGKLYEHTQKIVARHHDRISK